MSCHLGLGITEGSEDVFASPKLMTALPKKSALSDMSPASLSYTSKMTGGASSSLLKSYSISLTSKKIGLRLSSTTLV